MAAWEIFAVGCLGGAVPDLLRLIKARHDGAPKYVRTLFFWAMFAVLVFLGGLVAHFGGARDPMGALAFGYSAPQLLSRAVGGTGSDRGDLAGQTRLWSRLRWWWSF
jgi:hypothetical protein